MPSLQIDEEEEIKEETWVKILTTNKLLTRFLGLLVQTKAGNNSHKLKHEIIQLVYLFYQHKYKFYSNLSKSL